MAVFFTDAQINALDGLYPMGQVWDDSTNAQQIAAVNLAEQIWMGLNWRVNPFGDAGSAPTLRTRLSGLLIQHARVILETAGSSGQPITEFPVESAPVPAEIYAAIRPYLNTQVEVEGAKMRPMAGGQQQSGGGGLVPSGTGGSPTDIVNIQPDPRNASRLVVTRRNGDSYGIVIPGGGSGPSGTYLVDVVVNGLNVTFHRSDGVTTRITLPGGGQGGGLTQDQVDARIAEWARVASTTDIPEDKLPVTIARTADLNALTTRVTTAENEIDGLTAADIAVVSSGFDGNLATTDDNMQKVAQKVDDLVLGQGGGSSGGGGVTKQLIAQQTVATSADRVLRSQWDNQVLESDRPNYVSLNRAGHVEISFSSVLDCDVLYVIAEVQTSTGSVVSKAYAPVGYNSASGSGALEDQLGKFWGDTPGRRGSTNTLNVDISGEKVEITPGQQIASGEVGKLYLLKISEGAGGGGGGLNEARVRQIVENEVSNWAEDGNTDPIPASKLTNAPDAGFPEGGNTENEQGLFSVIRGGSIVRFWRKIREMRSTPGISSSIGHVMTVTGEGDDDYDWRAPDKTPEDDSIHERMLDAAVRVKLNNTDDQMARDAAAQAEADLRVHAANQAIHGGGGPGGADALARAAAAMAQLDIDTVIAISPDFVAGETDARNMNVSIRHPLNAYSDARLVYISVSGQSPIYVGYDHTVLEQSVKAGLPETLFSSSSFAERLVAGNFIDVEVRLVTGRGATGSDIKFVRTIDVPVVAAGAQGGGAALSTRVPVRSSPNAAQGNGALAARDTHNHAPWHVGADTPTGADVVEGFGWWDSENNLLKVHDGAKFVSVSAPDVTITITPPIPGVTPAVTTALKFDGDSATTSIPGVESIPRLNRVALLEAVGNNLTLRHYDRAGRLLGSLWSGVVGSSGTKVTAGDGFGAGDGDFILATQGSDGVVSISELDAASGLLNYATSFDPGRIFGGTGSNYTLQTVLSLGISGPNVAVPRNVFQQQSGRTPVMMAILRQPNSTNMVIAMKDESSAWVNKGRISNVGAALSIIAATDARRTLHRTDIRYMVTHHLNFLVLSGGNRQIVQWEFKEQGNIPNVVDGSGNPIPLENDDITLANVPTQAQALGNSVITLPNDYNPLGLHRVSAGEIGISGGATYFMLGEADGNEMRVIR